MSRLTPVSWKIFDCILKLLGFHFSRQKGSHRVYTRKNLARPLIVPVHSKDIAAGIINSNLNSSGTSREDYFAALEQCR
ncbi:MAG: hypothetical protein CSA32_04510 [Desulfobulbus propionicus]|nr:MAG: hypothetical protein CSA32_04510 [Desulfobulbus propionicus]